MKLTQPHERVLERTTQYDLDLIPIGRAYVDDLNHQNFKEGGVYVLFRPIDLSPESEDFQERLDTLCEEYIPEVPEQFMVLETDRKELSSMLSRSRMGLNKEEAAEYERQFPLGKSRGYEVFVKGGNGKLEVLALRETNTIHTSGRPNHDLIPYE